MCDRCYKHDYLCSDCGKVIDEEFKDLIPFTCLRKDIKNIVMTSTSNNFVWLLMFNETPVKIGYGSLVKLLNETRPNATYVRFTHVHIYYCNSEEQRNEFATKSMGYIDGLLNRKGVKNNKYKAFNEIVMNCSREQKVKALGEPDFRIGDMGYWLCTTK